MISVVLSSLGSVVDLGAVVPVEAPHLGVHDALVGGGEHLGRGHVLVVPRVAVAECTRKMFYRGHLIRATLETSVGGVLYLGPSLVRLKI